MCSLTVTVLGIGLFIGLVNELTKVAWLTVAAGLGRQFRCGRNVINLGKAEENEVGWFGDAEVVTRNACIERGGQEFVLKDLSRREGTILNGQKIDRTSFFHALAGASLAKNCMPGLRVLTQRLASSVRIRAVPYRDGAPLNVCWQDDNPWHRALQRAGLEYRGLYLLRHTYTFLMLSAGKPLQWVAAQLGHREVGKLTRRTADGEMRTSFRRARSNWKSSSERFGICRRLRPKRGRTCQEFLAGAADC